MRTYSLFDDDPNADIAASPLSEHIQRPAVDLTAEVLLHETPQPNPQRAPLWRPEDFTPASLGRAEPFWRTEILKDRNITERNTLLGWLKGVNVHEFVDPRAQGVSQGKTYSGADLTEVEFPNHVPIEHIQWVDSEVLKLVQQGSLADWSTVADVSKQPRPRMVLPLGVEPDKPRLIYDARWLNLMCKHMPFAMDSVGKVAQCSWRGAHQVTLDHKSGFHHVGLDPESWQDTSCRSRNAP